MDLWDSLAVIKAKMNTGKEAMRVACPICDYPTGILLVDRSGFQDRTCSWCHDESTFVKLASGTWKIKSRIGIEKIDSSGNRTWREKLV